MLHRQLYLLSCKQTFSCFSVPYFDFFLRRHNLTCYLRTKKGRHRHFAGILLLISYETTFISRPSYWESLTPVLSNPCSFLNVNQTDFFYGSAGSAVFRDCCPSCISYGIRERHFPSPQADRREPSSSSIPVFPRSLLLCCPRLLLACQRPHLD